MKFPSLVRSSAALSSSHVGNDDGDSMTRDDKDLMRLGKEPVLKRNLGFMSALGLACTILITWEAMIVISTAGLLNGGPAGLFWGYIINFIGNISAFAVQAEMASMAPTASGQYHWVTILAPEKPRRFLSYITGLLTTTGWQVGTASSGYLISTVLQAVITDSNPDYVPQAWHALLIIWAALLFGVMINTIADTALARFKGALLVLHILGFFAVMIPLVVMSSHNSASFVFKTFVNEGGWSSQGLSFLVGMPTAVFSLLPPDATVHLYEEIRNASTTVPRVMLYSIILNGILGLAMLVPYLFCIPDIEATIAASKTLNHSFIYVFVEGTGSVAAGAAMTTILIVMNIAAFTDSIASASRLLWSFSRGKGIPGWQWLSKVDQRTNLPTNAVIITATVIFLLSFVTLGSTFAFFQIVNLIVSVLYASYIVSSSLILYRRISSIKPYDPSVAVIEPGSLQWGPFVIPGAWGILNNLFAVVYMVFMVFWMFWLASSVVTTDTMNWNCLSFSAVLILATIWYYVRGRGTYVMPVAKIELR